MSFKGNFLLWILVELAWFGLQLAFVGVIFSQTTTVGTWTVWQVVLLTGTSNFIQQIYQAFFLVNCTNLSELVRTGKMDFLLLLPVNTRFLVSTRQVDLPVVCQRRVRRLRDDLCGGEIAFAPDGRAIPRLRRVVRRRDCWCIIR